MYNSCRSTYTYILHIIWIRIYIYTLNNLFKKVIISQLIAKSIRIVVLEMYVYATTTVFNVNIKGLSQNKNS